MTIFLEVSKFNFSHLLNNDIIYILGPILHLNISPGSAIVPLLIGYRFGIDWVSIGHRLAHG